MEVIFVIAVIAIVLLFKLSKALLKYSFIILLVFGVLFCMLMKECDFDVSKGRGKSPSCEAGPVGCSQISLGRDNEREEK